MTQGRQPSGGDEGDAFDTTSLHLRGAEEGDGASLEWIVQRFSPLLLAQARFRLGERLRRIHDPEDLVDEVWAITLPRLAELSTREGRRTPVLLKFLTTTLLRRVNDWVKVEIAGPRGRRHADAMTGSDTSGALAKLPTDSSGVVTSVVRRERHGAIASALEELAPEDREVIVLRAIEQHSGSTVALLLNLSEKAVSMRYRRALERLRTRLPGSIFEEIALD